MKKLFLALLAVMCLGGTAGCDKAKMKHVDASTQVDAAKDAPAHDAHAIPDSLPHE